MRFKATTLLAIVAAVVGAGVIFWLATRRPTPTIAGSTSDAEGDASAAASGDASRAARVTTSVGTGLTGIAAGIAEAFAS